MKASLADAISRIKEAGFNWIKVELEANIGRDGESTCSMCDGSGNEGCNVCSGEGYVDSGNYSRISGEAVLEECGECSGDGMLRCADCDGSGTSGSFYDEDHCDEFLRNFVPDEVRQRLIYGSFYDDGSVDSEFTFTLNIDHVEDVVKWIEAFKALAEECGGDMDVSGAGMHITVMDNQTYNLRRNGLNTQGAENFKSEVTKLLPALFFLASSDSQCRPLNYRHARVGTDKYCAVSTHDDSCFEFRVFETCYKKPEHFFDNIEVIANALEFYKNPQLTVKSLGKQFGFIAEAGHVAGLYTTPEQLQILNATVKHLKPKDKSFKKLREERGLHTNIKELTNKNKERVINLRKEYIKYSEQWHHTKNRKLTESEQRDVDWMMAESDYSREDAERQIKGVQENLITLREFIQNNTPRQQRYGMEMVTV